MKIEVQMEIKVPIIQVFEIIIVGIKNGRYEATINLIEDCIKEIKSKEESNDTE